MEKFFLCLIQHRKSLCRGSVASLRIKCNVTLRASLRSVQPHFLGVLIWVVSQIVCTLLPDWRCSPHRWHRVYPPSFHKNVLRLLIRCFARATERRIFKRCNEFMQVVNWNPSKISSWPLWQSGCRECERSIKMHLLSYVTQLEKKKSKLCILLDQFRYWILILCLRINFQPYCICKEPLNDVVYPKVGHNDTFCAFWLVNRSVRIISAVVGVCVCFLSLREFCSSRAFLVNIADKTLHHTLQRERDTFSFKMPVQLFHSWSAGKTKITCFFLPLKGGGEEGRRETCIWFNFFARFFI